MSKVHSKKRLLLLLVLVLILVLRLVLVLILVFVLASRLGRVVGAANHHDRAHGQDTSHQQHGNELLEKRHHRTILSRTFHSYQLCTAEPGTGNSASKDS